MPRLFTIALVCALTLGVPAFADDIDAATAQITEAWEKHGSMSAALTVEAGPPTGVVRIGMRGEGTVQALRGDDGEKYKSIVRINFSEPMNATMQVEALFDGESIQLTNDSLGRRESRKAEPGVYQGAVPPGGALLVDALKKDADLRLGTDSQLDGVDAFVIEGRAKKSDAAPAAVARLRAYVAKETGALLKLELYESDAVLTAVITQKDFEWDVALDPAAFTPGDNSLSLLPAATPAQE
jgi:outer membrane lipoprotein-sorting protein